MREQRLIVVADYACPFCCLAEHGVARLRAAGATVDGAAFELRPSGTPLPDANAAWLVDAWKRVVEPLAAEADLVLRRPDFMTRTRKAHEAAAHARGEGRYEAMHDAIYRAYWQDGRDIGRIDVLVDIGRGVGLDPGRLRVALDIDQWTARIEQDALWAARLRLSGVPAYVKAGPDGADTPVAADVRVGLQGYEDLRAWVERDHDI